MVDIEVWNSQSIVYLILHFKLLYHVLMFSLIVGVDYPLNIDGAAHKAPPSLRFSRQEYWSGLPFPSPMH